jgi:hypothetical protein
VSIWIVSAWLTTEELLERYTLVFEKARELGLPVTWCLAGGYQRDENSGISTTHLNAVLLQQPDQDPSFFNFARVQLHLNNHPVLLI